MMMMMMMMMMMILMMKDVRLGDQSILKRGGSKLRAASTPVPSDPVGMIDTGATELIMPKSVYANFQVREPS